MFAFTLMMPAHVVVGEVVPKNLAIEKADQLSVLVAPVLLVFYRFAEPFVWVIERTSSWLSKPIGVRGGRRRGHSPEELSSSWRHRNLGPYFDFEKEAISNLIDLSTSPCAKSGAAQQPRHEGSGVDIDDVLR